MSYDPDQQLESQAAGAADWDAGLNQNFGILARGYHTVARVGHAVSTADVLWMSSGGFFYKFDPNSLTIRPTAITFLSAASGDSIQALLVGIVRSMSVAFVPGIDYFVSAVAPGVIVTSPNQATIGTGMDGGGLYFNPRAVNVASIDTSSLGESAPQRIFRDVAITVTSYMLVFSDGCRNGLLRTNTICTVYIPANGVTSYADGTQIDGVGMGGKVTIIPSSSNVLLNSHSGFRNTDARYDGWSLVKMGVNSWWLGGTLVQS